MINKLIFFCVTLLFISSCKKSDVKEYPVSEAMKKACLFQKNSYWVFLNDSTGVTDCTYVKSEPISVNSTDELNNIVDNIQTNLQSGILHQFYLSGKLFYPHPTGNSFLVDIGYNICGPGKPAFILYDDGLTNHQGVEGFNCGSSKMPYWDYSDFAQLDKYSSFNVNDLLFTQVEDTRTIFLHPYSTQSNIDTVDFYYSPGNGLVKIVLKTDTSWMDRHIIKRAIVSWSLLRYKVVQ